MCCSLSGLSAVIWLEGINDLSSGASAEAVIAGITEGVRRIRARGGIRIIVRDNHAGARARPPPPGRRRSTRAGRP